MTEHTPALAAMLLRGRPGRRVCGKRHVCMFPLEGFFFRVGRARQINTTPNSLSLRSPPEPEIPKLSTLSLLEPGALQPMITY